MWILCVGDAPLTVVCGTFLHIQWNFIAVFLSPVLCVLWDDSLLTEAQKLHATRQLSGSLQKINLQPAFFYDFVVVHLLVLNNNLVSKAPTLGIVSLGVRHG